MKVIVTMEEYPDELVPGRPSSTSFYLFGQWRKRDLSYVVEVVGAAGQQTSYENGSQKSWLQHTQWQTILFTGSQWLHVPLAYYRMPQYPSMLGTVLKVCDSLLLLRLAIVSWACRHPCVLSCSSNCHDWPQQKDNWLELMVMHLDSDISH